MNIEELKILALAATAGPWFNDSKNSPDDVSIWAGDINHNGAEFLGNIGDSRIREIGIAFDIETNNGNYISAANPLAIIELIDRLQAAESERDKFEFWYRDTEKKWVSACDKFKAAESKIAEHRQQIEQQAIISSLYRDERDQLRSIVAEMEEQPVYGYVNPHDEQSLKINGYAQIEAKQTDYSKMPLYAAFMRRASY